MSTTSEHNLRYTGNEMLPQTYQENRVFERKIRAKNGQLMLVRFTVSTQGGKVRGRILSIEPVASLPGDTLRQEKICLPKAPTCNAQPICKSVPQAIISPFTSLQFFVSQPTRAPSLFS